MGITSAPTAPRDRAARPKKRPGGAAPISYAELVLHASRIDGKTIAVAVKVSPAGTLKPAVSTNLSEAEARAIKDSFRSSGSSGGGGRMNITVEQAVEVGRKLAGALLPPAVFRLLAQSMAEVGKKEGGGLRLRLDLDPSLIDLPWEYLYRPDRREGTAVSGFLLMDPSISMVRMPVNRKVVVAPIEGAQRLNFVGTMWEGRLDGWDVWREFSQLRRALRPVDRYLTPEFAVASDLDVFEADIEDENAIFHYAGHCDFERDGSAFLVREMPSTGKLDFGRKTRCLDLAKSLKRTKTRLVVLSACNSGYWMVVEPLLRAGMPAVIGVNGGVSSDSTIEFCTRLYESLAIGLSLDEAAGRARLAVMEWGSEHGLFDWGLYMVYMQSADATIFPRATSTELLTRQVEARRDHRELASQSLQRARELDGLNFGAIMSELSKRRVLILGRFSKRRLAVLEAIKAHLAEHENKYIPELFTFERPDSRDLVESILGFAALSRFVIADLSEPRSIQSELQAIVPNFQSVPIVPIINEGGREFATFSSLARRPNVVTPTMRYRDIDDLLRKLDSEIVPQAEAMRGELQPAGWTG